MNLYTFTSLQISISNQEHAIKKKQELDLTNDGLLPRRHKDERAAAPVAAQFREAGCGGDTEWASGQVRSSSHCSRFVFAHTVVVVAVVARRRQRRALTTRTHTCTLLRRRIVITLCALSFSQTDDLVDTQMRAFDGLSCNRCRVTAAVDEASPLNNLLFLPTTSKHH
jgi:hypothetical protein